MEDVFVWTEILIILQDSILKYKEKLGQAHIKVPICKNNLMVLFQ